MKNFNEVDSNTEIKVKYSLITRLENLVIGTWIWYSVEDRLLFSERFSRMTGISKNSYYDFKSFFDIIHGDDLLQFIDDIDDMLKGASPHWIYFRIIKPDNSTKKVKCFLESMTTEFGELLDITGVCFNVTE